jgi:hypothetical protein
LRHFPYVVLPLRGRLRKQLADTLHVTCDLRLEGIEAFEPLFAAQACDES